MKKKLLINLSALILLTMWLLSGRPIIWKNPIIPPIIQSVYAASTVTAATGGGSISADSAGGNYTSLIKPVITEGSVGDVGVGTIIVNAPSGFNFATTANSVTLTVTYGSCSGSGNTSVKLGTGTGSSTQTVTPTATTITHNVKTASKGVAGCVSTLTYTGIKVRPTAGTPLNSGNITKSSSSTSTIRGVTNGSTNFGTLTEVVGAKNKLAITTQPSSTVTVSTDFTIKPVVKLQDQFGNTVTTDSSSTITRTAVLSTQACGGTAASGSITSTPASGSAFASGVMTYTAMQHSTVESIKICFTSSSVTSALSNTINVINLPVVTTQNVSSVSDITATANGNITATNGENADKRGFVYDTSSHSLPGDVSPGTSGYANYAEDTGSYGTGAFTIELTSLSSGATYYVRAYVHNSAGYSYGTEVSFTTVVISISITSNGVISYGNISSGTSKDTTSGDTQTAKNDSAITEDFNIKTSAATGGTPWTIGSTPGANVFVHEYSTDSGNSWTKFTAADSYLTLATGVSPNGTQNFDLRLTSPTNSDSQPKTIIITIQAIQH